MTEPNAATLAYSQAKAFAKEGRYADALDRHEWFHQNALIHEPAMYGVRLSFALSSWAKLGKKYPPAMTSMLRERDQAIEDVIAGNNLLDSFHEAVSINRALNLGEASLDLFRRVEELHPESAENCFRRIEDLAFANDADLFLRYTRDLLLYWNKCISWFREKAALPTLPPGLPEEKFAGLLAAKKRLSVSWIAEFRQTAGRLATFAEQRNEASSASTIRGGLEDIIAKVYP
jgi:hypothetical protein